MTARLRAYGWPADGMMLDGKGIRHRYWTWVGKCVLYYREHYWRIRDDGSMDRRWVWVADGTEEPDPAVVFAELDTTE